MQAHQRAGHMDASDLIKALHNILRRGGRSHMAQGLPGGKAALHRRDGYAGDFADGIGRKSDAALNPSQLLPSRTRQ